MSSVAEHYDRVLSDVYSWMYGGYEHALAVNTRFFAEHGVAPAGSGVAVDLGAGCGFQSIPLAQLGFSVTAIDIDRKLLDELRGHSAGLPIETVQDDLLRFDAHERRPIELAVCMVDTLVHLESRERVIELFGKLARALEEKGRLIITFRDQSRELRELDRFIPVRADDDIIFTCFLEYEPETVKVHDLVYRRLDGAWKLHKSFYRKLRLSKDWVEAELSRAGFSTINSAVDKGFVTVIARK